MILVKAHHRPSGWTMGVAAPLALLALMLVAHAVQAASCTEPVHRVSAEGRAVVDAGHPWVEQRFVVSLDAEALPSSLAPRAVVVSALPRLDDTAPGTVAPAAPPQIYFVDDATGQVLPRVSSDGMNPGGAAPGVVLDCDEAAPCVRALRVIFAWPSEALTGTHAIGWDLTLQVDYRPAFTTCEPLPEGRIAINAEPPVLGSATERAKVPAGGGSTSGELSARHITIRTERAPAPTDVLRVTVAGPPKPDYGWRGWIRVLPDASTRPLIDTALGELYPVPWQTADVPVLGDCRPGQPCERGYWIVLAAHSAIPPWDPFGRSTIETLRWDLELVSLGPGADPSGVSIAVDDRSDALAATTTLEIPVQEWNVGRSGSIEALDITLRLTRPEPIDGLDPMTAGAAIVPLFVEGASVRSSLTGPGAPALEVYFSGHHTNYLVGHPLDGCAPIVAGDPCAVTFQLVTDVAPQAPTGSQHEGAQVEWATRIHGVPPGTTYSLAAPRALPRPSEPREGIGDVAVVALVGLVVGIVFLVARRERRAAD